jgi:hypothetical protein
LVRSSYDNTIVTTGVKHIKFLAVPKGGALTKGARLRPKKGIIGKVRGIYTETKKKR